MKLTWRAYNTLTFTLLDEDQKGIAGVAENVTRSQSKFALLPWKWTVLLPNEAQVRIDWTRCEGHAATVEKAIAICDSIVLNTYSDVEITSENTPGLPQHMTQEDLATELTNALNALAKIRQTCAYWESQKADMKVRSWWNLGDIAKVAMQDYHSRTLERINTMRDCPECGGKAEIKTFYTGEQALLVRVKCSKCGFFPEYVQSDDQISVWNNQK